MGMLIRTTQQGSTAPPAIVTVTTTSLPAATTGVAYSQQLAASGGSPPYTWLVTGLPAGLTASAAGLITGTPTTAGSSTAAVIAKDSSTPAISSITVSLTLVVNPAGTTAPSPPVAMYLGEVGLTSIAFAWGPPTTGPTPDGYCVYRNGTKVYPNATFTGLIKGDGSVGSWPWVVDGNAPGALLNTNTAYSYYVTSSYQGVESVPGPTINATTLAPGPSAQPAPVAPLTWIAPFTLPTGTVWTCTNTSFSAVSGTGTLGNVGCSLNWALNGNGTTNLGYAPGDLIVLTAGAVYTAASSSSYGYTLPNKSNPSNLWTYIISSEDPVYKSGGLLPAYSNNTALGSGVTDYSGTGGNWVHRTDAAAMPVIEVSAINGVAFTPAQGANYTRVVGIWFRALIGGSGPLTFTAAPAAGSTSATLTTAFTGTTGSYSLIFSTMEARNVTLTNGSTAVTWTTGLATAPTATAGWQSGSLAGCYLVQMPYLNSATPPWPTPCESIYFDRCRFGHPPSQLYAATNAFTFNFLHVYIYGHHTLVHQCLLEGASDYFQQTGTSPYYGYPSRESKAICIMGGSNICINNCYLDAVSEAFFIGGGYVAQTVPPTDITISTSFFWKDPTWSNSGAAADIKNHIEFKCGNRAEIHHNVMTNNLAGVIAPQGAKAMTFWAHDQTGGNPWTATTDVNIHDNLIVHNGSGMDFPGSAGGDVGNVGPAWAPNARFRFANNFVYLDPVTNPLGGLVQPWCCRIGYNCPDVIYDHNTFIINYSNTYWFQNASYSAGIFNITTNNIGQLFNAPRNPTFTPNGRQTYGDRMTVTNNILDGTYTAFAGNGLGHGMTTFNTLFPSQASTTVANNLYVFDTISYTGNDHSASGTYANIGFASWSGYTSVPLPPAITNWNVTTGPYATASTTGGPIGAKF